MLITREWMQRRLDHAERKARASKLTRLLSNPILYPFLMFFNKLVYPVTHKSIVFHPDTFFGLRMKTLLPSGTDLALNGMKGHDSEIRLTRFLCNTLQPGDTFVDVGAHYGYYTLLASVLTGQAGEVHAVEASAATMRILSENTRDKSNVTVYHAAASNITGEITFYEYPGPYAEWNTTIKDAYQAQPWIRKLPKVENIVPAILLDDILIPRTIATATIKIDVEGGEYAALQGLDRTLRSGNLTIVLEYHFKPGARSLHHDALALLDTSGYTAYAIARDGSLHELQDVDAYMREQQLTTDNLVFQKNKGV